MANGIVVHNCRCTVLLHPNGVGQDIPEPSAEDELVAGDPEIAQLQSFFSDV